MKYQLLRILSLLLYINGVLVRYSLSHLLLHGHSIVQARPEAEQSSFVGPGLQLTFRQFRSVYTVRLNTTRHAGKRHETPDTVTL